MAVRPVFLPDPHSLVNEQLVTFEWFAGFAASQKQKSIRSLHAAAITELSLHGAILEVSTKSETRLGNQLSAFNLRTEHPEHGSITLESAFQGSKVFSGSGQHDELYTIADGREVKRRIRDLAAGQLEGFQFAGHRWELAPRTAFYDWLYLRAVRDLAEVHTEAMDELLTYRAFTDIEFNPDKSFNCQARSCALLVSLHHLGELGTVEDPAAFVKLLRESGYGAAPPSVEEATLF